MKLQYDDWQKEFLETEGDKILCTGRQVGKTEVCAADCAEWAMKTDKKGIILMTAPQECQAENLFNKTLAYFTEHYPKALMTGSKKPTKTEIRLKKGITILCKTAGQTGIGLRFLTVIREYVDECAQMAEMCWECIDPHTMTTGGDTIYISTPFGMSGRFYECWINKNNAYDSFKRFSINSEDCVKNRKISESWTEEQREKGLKKIAEAKVRLTAKKFMQEYMGEFVPDLCQFFPDSIIVKCQKLKRTGSISSKADYYMGIDVGGRGGDPSVISILERKDKNRLLQTESIILFNDMTTQTERNILLEDSKWKCRKIYIDDGGMGVGIFDHLLENPQTRRKIIPINNSARALDFEENRRKKLIKEDLYNNLLGLMEREEIELLDDPEIFQSLKSIQLEIDEVTREIKISGNYSHIAESLVRAAWCKREKGTNCWIV